MLSQPRLKISSTHCLASDSASTLVLEHHSTTSKQQSLSYKSRIPLWMVCSLCPRESRSHLAYSNAKWAVVFRIPTETVIRSPTKLEEWFTWSKHARRPCQKFRPACFTHQRPNRWNLRISEQCILQTNSRPVQALRLGFLLDPRLSFGFPKAAGTAEDVHHLFA